MQTSDAQIRSHIRQLWLRSKERAEALKRANYSCNKCGVKQSKAQGREQKVEVHHLQENGINWERVINVIREELLNDNLEVLCPDCHREETYVN